MSRSRDKLAAVGMRISATMREFMNVSEQIKKILKSSRARTRLPLSASAITFGLALSCSGGAAWAAEGASDAQSQQPLLLEEVVVTAQFREQGLQKTPVAITAVNSEQIQQRSMTRLTDIAAFAPNVVSTPASTGYGPAAQTYIRGVGQSDSSFALEPGVGIYVDDVYNGILLGSVFDLLDLDRVEVLRGPQGTLAGKNSLGGAIKLFSKKPDGDGGGFVEATYGDFNRTDVRAGGNFTLVPDTLYARVAGVSKHRDGYMKRVDYACEHPGSGVPSSLSAFSNCELGTEGGQDLQAARVALRWIASDSVEDNLIADVTQDRSEVAATKLLQLNNAQVPNGAQFITGPRDYTTYATYANLGFTDPAIFAGQPGAGTHPAFSQPTTAPVNAYGISNNVTWKFGDNLSLVSITGYRRYSGDWNIDYDGSPYSVENVHNTFTHRQFTQELRLNGSSFSLLDWTVGAYYYDAKSQFGGLRMISPGTPGENLFDGNDQIPAKSKSGFAHAVYHLTSQLSLIGGLRYTDEDKDYTFARENPFAPGPTYTAAGAVDGTTGSYSGNKVDYRAGVEYQWTQDVMTYVQYSTGFKGGGVNPRPFVVEQEQPFNPETLKAAEMGVKSDMLNHRLRVNAAVFFNQYEDIIFTNTQPTPNSALNATPVNAGDADVKGAELEVEARPIGGLSINASASYLDFKLTRIAPGITSVNLDTQQIFAPEKKASIGVQYELPIGTAGTLIPRVDGAYQSSFFTAIDNSPDGKVDGYTVANARLTWQSASGDWQSALEVTNLTDKFYYLNKFRQAAPLNFVIGQPGAPRQWAVSIRRTF
jgi:iron complex outermembrane receptor protein